MTDTQSLNVIALISGGKDSFYSLVHCLRNGHRVVALGNLYPAPTPPSTNQHEDGPEEEEDLNSFMYQTVGHTVIPLYEQALGIPLYRQEIRGGAVQTGRSYAQAEVIGEQEDETESIVPLLKRILDKHPEANAISTGAILSTYQRTRIESVAVRLGLTPLAFLWQYPVLPPGLQSSLLYDMQDVGLDARVVKVASGGLDEGFLWQNVADGKVIGRLERAMSRFGVEGDGATIGEGGEFETLVVDGPSRVFKGRIVVKEEDLKVVREGGGSAWLKIMKAEVVTKEKEDVAAEVRKCRVPALLEPRFQEVFDGLPKLDVLELPHQSTRNGLERYSFGLHKPSLMVQKVTPHLTFTSYPNNQGGGIAETAKMAIHDIRHHLVQSSLQPADIVFTLIILRSMQDFAAVNKIYGSLFTEPNPPSRVTISCGDLLPANTDLIIQIRTPHPKQKTRTREALHVQSRSYWAPANIGPYSQGISVPLAFDQESDSDSNLGTFGCYIAGQIPLVPHTMTLPPPVGAGEGEFRLQTALALQHLWRVAVEMKVEWFVSGVVFLPRSGASTNIQTQARIASLAWEALHQSPSIEEEGDEFDNPVDLWENKHYSGKASIGASKSERTLPNFNLIKDPFIMPELGKQTGHGGTVPPMFAVEVEELPRGAMIEWHAHMGVVGGCASVKLFDHEAEDAEGSRWCIYQCVVNDSVVHSLVMIPWSKEKEKGLTALEGAMLELGTGIGKAHTAYVDCQIREPDTLHSGGLNIPCRSIWGTAGSQRLAAVLMFETLC